MEKIKIKTLFNLDETIAKNFLKEYEYPWEAIPHIEEYILQLGKTLPKDEYIEKENNVWIHKSAIIYNHVYIAGPTIICAKAEIREFSFIRGKVIVGKGAVVGNSCELKNAILFNEAKVPHFNYIGDSIIGYNAHMGAGSLTSNLKNDGSDIIIKYESTKFETNMRKLGAMVGDGAQIGCNTILNPGVIIGPNTNIYPLSSVRGYIKANSIYKSYYDIVEKY